MTKKSDFNDLANEAGAEAVRKSVEAAQPAEPARAPVHASAQPSAADDGKRWDEPLPFNQIETPELPPELLPGVFGEYADALSEALQTPPTMAVLFTLAVLSLALQRKFKVSPFGDDYAEPVCIWAVILADSGERKSALIQRLLAGATEGSEAVRPDASRNHRARHLAQDQPAPCREAAGRRGKRG